MPRHIASLLAAPQYALDARMGLSQLTQLLARAGGDGMPKGIPDEADRSESWLDAFVRQYGHCHYYVNRDGSIVHSLDVDRDERLKDGAVAVIPVRGLLVKEADLFDETYWGMTSTTRLARLLTQLREDDRVAAAVQDVFSGGGQVWGTEAYGESGKAFASEKPLITHVDHLAASAAYWGSSPSHKVLLTGRTSEVGSIGVMLAWMDLIPYFEKEGVVFREFYAPESAKKNEEWRALRKENNESLMEEGLSMTAQLFQEHVRSTRGARLNTRDKTVLQGRMFQGDDAIQAGLADGYATLAEAIALARKEAPEQQPQAQITETMNIAKKLVALAAGLFAGKVDATQEDIDEANTGIQEEVGNVAFISKDEQQRLANAAEAIATAERATEAANAAREASVTKLQEAQDEVAKVTTEKDALAAQLNDLKSAINAAGTKLKEEIKEGVSLLESIASELEASRASVDKLTLENATLKAGPASDGKPAGVVNGNGDVDSPQAEQLTEEEEAFRTAPLGK